jgi:hypothetical protein
MYTFLHTGAPLTEAQDLPIIYLWTCKTIAGLSAKVQRLVPVSDGLIRVQGAQVTR